MNHPPPNQLRPPRPTPGPTTTTGGSVSRTTTANQRPPLTPIRHHPPTRTTHPSDHPPPPWHPHHLPATLNHPPSPPDCYKTFRFVIRWFVNTTTNSVRLSLGTIYGARRPKRRGLRFLPAQPLNTASTSPHRAPIPTSPNLCDDSFLDCSESAPSDSSHNVVPVSAR